jgi:hypothetical protein
MMPRFERSELRQTTARQYVLRFVFGAVVTTATGLIARTWGPAIGGLFLAFPALLPASLTFVKDEDGRHAACDDARGACLGAVATIAFAFTVWVGSERWFPPITLGLALAIWIGAGLAQWLVMTRIARHARKSSATESPRLERQ